MITWAEHMSTPAGEISIGWTAREGGVSSAPWESANLGYHVGDVPENVRRNRALLQDELGTECYWMEQVHSDQVANLFDTQLGQGRIAYGVDGLFAPVAFGSCALAVMVADCAPVLLADDEGAIAAIHVGRAGLEAGILTKAAAYFSGNLTAVIGPSICGQCYEVPEEMARASLSPACTSWNTSSIDIPAGIYAQLEALDVSKILRSGLCTFEDSRFFSYRRAGGATGRFVGVVRRMALSAGRGDTP